MSLLAVALLLGLVTIGDALECYECSTADDPTCDDFYLMPVEHKAGCDDSNKWCSKVKTRGTVFGIKATTVERTCAGTDFININCLQSDRIKSSLLGTKREVWSCQCMNDLCNSGNYLTLSLQLLIAACVAKFLL